METKTVDSAAAHSPAPWKKAPNSGHVFDAKGGCVAITDHRETGTVGMAFHEGSDTIRANATLIASAPTLKAENERLKEVLAIVLGQLDLLPDGNGSLSMFNTKPNGDMTNSALAIRAGLRTEIMKCL